MSDDCQYCAIASGDAPSQRVYENKRTVAFMEIDPTSLGHTVIVPRVHSRDLTDADPLDVAAVAMTAQLVARAACTALRADGVVVVNASGAAASQAVFHLHFEVVPRYLADQLALPWTRARLDREQVRQAAAALRQGLRFA